jgi:radical SAM protein with 4Fe4S-binding SPASM domain
MRGNLKPELPREMMVAKVFQAFKSLLTRKVAFECDLLPFTFERVPLKKIVNWILTEASVHVQPERPWGMPTIMQMEPTNHCNLRCAVCPVTTGMDRDQGYMDLMLFKKLIDEVSDYLFLILLWDWGEPLLNPSVLDMISYAQNNGVKVVMSTNGHLLARDNYAERVVTSGLDTLIVAVDGISQETYQQYRQGGRLEQVLEGVKKVVQKKRELNALYPRINFRFIVMKHNEHEVSQLKEFARSLGVDVLTLKTFNPSFRGQQKPDEGGRSFLPGENRYRRFSYFDDYDNPVRVKRNSCKCLWNAPTIHWNGSVCSCFTDIDEKWPLGDLTSQHFKAIWSGEKYRGLRRRFRNDWERLSMCRDCSYAYEGGDCGRDTVAEAVFYTSRCGTVS